MAGAGYKLFNTGDVLTAAQVNTYLQEQVVMVFANAAARTTALSSVLAEGMVSYLKDTNATEVYDGSAWVGIGNSGDITGITTGATSGLTGGVTSGTADLKLNTTAKGGLLVGTGSGTVSELTVGSNNTVLTADSTTATGLKWAVAPSAGKILQVVSTNKSDTFSIASTTYTDVTGLSVTITPNANTSTIYVIASINHQGTFGSCASALRLLRDSTAIAIGDAAGSRIQESTEAYAVDGSGILSSSIVIVDSPATTSAITYKIQQKATAAGTAYINRSSTDTNSSSYGRAFSSITVFEIGA